jgi:hypothetical protein
MKMTPNQTNTNTGDLGQLDTAPLLAFIFSKCGEEGLRQVLESWTEPETDPGNASSYAGREMLEDAANELEERGLSKVAAILLDVAVHAPSGLDHMPSYYRTSFGERADTLWRSHWVENRERHLERLRPKGPALADYKRVKPIPRPSHKDKRTP